MVSCILQLHAYMFQYIYIYVCVCIDYTGRVSHSHEMSDFFSGIYRGIQNPTVVMNDGPLPPQDTSGSGYPAGFGGIPGERFLFHPLDSKHILTLFYCCVDARINQASTLLGDGSVSPYVYGDSDRLSTQTAYLNIPHAAYRIIPPMNIPDPLGSPEEVCTALLAFLFKIRM